MKQKKVFILTVGCEGWWPSPAETKRIAQSFKESLGKPSPGYHNVIIVLRADMDENEKQKYIAQCYATWDEHMTKLSEDEISFQL